MIKTVKNSKAFTLVELLIAMGLSVLVSGIVVGVLFLGAHSNSRLTNQSDAQHNTRLAMEFFTKSLQTAKTGLNMAENETKSSINFTNLDENTVSIGFVNTDDKTRHLVRRSVNGSNEIVADRILDIQFKRGAGANKNTIDITIKSDDQDRNRLGERINFVEYTTRVFLRNYE